MSNIVSIPVTQDQLNIDGVDRESLRVSDDNKTVSIDSTALDVSQKLSSYKNEHGLPYVAEYLNLGDFYNIDIDGSVKPMVEEISAFLMEHVNGDNLLFGKAWLDKLTNELSFRDDEAVIDKLKRLHSFVKSKDRIEKQARKKELMLKLIEMEKDRHP